MCFSATASFTSAVVIGSIGLFSLAKARDKKWVWFACIPLIFALQQALEGGVWQNLGAGYAYGFLAIALIIWPIWIPASLYLLEKHQNRKKWMLTLFMLGILVALASCYSFWVYGLQVTVGRHILYTLPVLQVSSLYLQIIYFAAYCLAVVGPLFLSSVKRMWLLGVTVSIGWVIANLFYALWFVSIWCFFGALCSTIVYLIVKKRR